MPTSSETLILDVQPWGALLVDRERRIRYASRPAAELLDADVHGLEGEPLDVAFPVDAGSDIALDIDGAFLGLSLHL